MTPHQIQAGLRPDDVKQSVPEPVARVPVNTGRMPRLSAGAVVVRRAAAEWLFLLLRAYRNWDFPKGVVEPGEDPLAAARREVREETSIEDLQFNWGEVFRETARYGHNKVARYYLAQTRTELITLGVNPALGRPEHNEWRWVSLDEASSLASPRLEPIVRWAAETIGASGER